MGDETMSLCEACEVYCNAMKGKTRLVKENEKIG